MKLSDALVLDARLAGETMERSIAGQVEFWARLGRAVDPLLNGAQAMAVSRRGAERSLAQILAEVDEPAGAARLAAHLAGLPYPHYEPCPDQPGCVVRTTASGDRTVGRFVNRVFTAVADG